MCEIVAIDNKHQIMAMLACTLDDIFFLYKWFFMRSVTHMCIRLAVCVWRNSSYSSPKDGRSKFCTEWILQRGGPTEKPRLHYLIKIETKPIIAIEEMLLQLVINWIKS